MKLTAQAWYVGAVVVFGLLSTGVFTWAARDEFEHEMSMAFAAIQQQVESDLRLELVEHYEKITGWRDILTVIPAHHESDINLLFRNQFRGGSQSGLRELAVFGYGEDAQRRIAGRGGSLTREFAISRPVEKHGPDSLRMDNPALFLKTVSALSVDGGIALMAPGRAGLAAASRQVVVLPVARLPAGSGTVLPVNRWLVVGLDFNAILAAEHMRGAHNMSLQLRDPAQGVILASLNPVPDSAAIKVSRTVALGSMPLELVAAASKDTNLGAARDWTWIVFGAGLAITLLMAYVAHSMLYRRAAQAEHATRLQRSVRESEQRFRDIVESSRDWVWEVNAEGVYTYSSPSSEWLFGYSPAQIIGTKGEFLWVSPDPRQWRTGAANTVRVFRHRTGASITLESHSVEILSPQRRVLGFRGFDRDISLRLQMEGELHALQGRLLKVIQAEGAGQTLMGLAHEINQPLAAIAAYNQACLRMADASGAVPEEIKAAIRATAENAMLAGDILRKFRGIVAAARVEREAMVAGKVVQDAVEIARSRIRQEGIHIAIGVDPGLPEVYGDPTLIKQVLLNLIGNAVEAMVGQPVRELAILVRREQTDKVRDKVRFEVMDTGSGVRERLRDKIFEPYFTTKAGGLGMGLAICRSIMEAHGESFEFSNKPEGGTVFSFTLGTRAD